MKTQIVDRLPTLSETTTRFVADLGRIDNLDGLARAMTEITAQLGFACYVLGQLPSTDYAGTNFIITDYPEAWRRTVYSRLLFGQDPIIDSLADAVAPFLWEEVPAYLAPTPSQREYLDAARTFGLSRGYAVPVKAPGEPTGAISFATINNTAVDRAALPFVVYIATAAYHRAVVIVRLTRAAKSPQIKLSELEIRALTGLAQGVSNYVIARRLALTNAACAELTQGILRKLGYGNRTLAAVRGLQLGLINYNDVLIG